MSIFRRGACALLMLLVLGLPLSANALTEDEARLARAAEHGEVVRLHILAEDDSPAAQALKLTVRDAILAAFGDALRALPDDADSVYAWLEAHQAELLAVAADTARAAGFAGEVSAEVGWLDLPEKRYGAVLLPEGTYRGLRVTLGAGRGRNWFCVLFPQLCLAAAGLEPPFPAALPADAPLGDGIARVLACWLVWP